MGEISTRKECIEELIKGNREAVFRYHDKLFSIAYYNDNRAKYISIGEYNGRFVDVKNASELLKVKIRNRTLEKIFSSLPDSAFDIY